MNNWNGAYGPLLIAEIGGNHEGDFEYAKKLCRLAIESKADYVKFQIYTGDTLVSRVENADRNKHFKKFELSVEQHIELARMVVEAGSKYTASVWDADAINWIDPYIGFYKIGSGDLTAYSVIEEIVKRKKPMIISTGISTEEEVLDTVKFIQSLNPMYLQPENLAVLQCTSMYPINYEDANLSVIPRLKQLTGLTIGYSDHTTDTKAMQYAYAMGAEVLEFHFTDSKEGKTFRDHLVSLTKEDVWALQDELQMISKLKGSPVKAPMDIEINNGHLTSFRRAVYMKDDVAAGTVITANDLITLRPNNGIDARDYYTLIGKKAAVNIKALEKLSADMFE